MIRILLLIGTLLPLIVTAQTFEKSVVASNGERIGFLEFRPADYTGPKHPLIIFLHGIGEKGNGTSQLKNVNCCGIPSYIRRGNKMRFTWQGKTESFVVLSPQLSKRYNWWQPFYTDELIKYAKANLNIDPDRIFVTGLSMGGGGTWNFASSSQARAEQLAGIAPVVAPCMMSNGCNIARATLPVMAIHVWDDRDAPASCTVNAIRSINSCDPPVTPNLIMYANGGHYVWVKRAFDTAHNYQNPNMYEWMLAQNRKFAPNRKPVARAGADQTITTADASITLSAANSSDADGSIVRFIWNKVSGPSKGTLSGTTTANLKITGLNTAGTYKFVVKVIDNRAEWNHDTVLVNVKKGDPTPNQLPVALANPDTTVFSDEAFTLDGTASKDGDGDITGYEWTKENGPESYKIADAWNKRTAVTELAEGVYTFRLKVSDNRGGTATDDVVVNVKKRDDPGTDTVPPANPPPTQNPPVTVANAIVVYPNPSKGDVTLSLNAVEKGASMAIIYDNMGRAVKKISFIKYYNSIQQNLPTSGLGRGVFYVDVLIGKSGRYKTRFIKQ